MIKKEEKKEYWRHEKTKAYNETAYKHIIHVTCDNSIPCDLVQWNDHLSLCDGEMPFLATRRNGKLTWTKQHEKQKCKQLAGHLLTNLA